MNILVRNIAHQISIEHYLNGEIIKPFQGTPQKPVGAVLLAYLTVQREAFKKAALLAHNYLRSLHGVKPLILSPELNETAQASAEKIAERGHVIYSDSIAIGENISILPMESRRFFANDVIQHWYDEIVNYDFGKPGWKKGSIRFTQLIWRSSCEMGVGIVRQEDKKKAVVVVHYRPAGNGNMPGEFDRNVLPIKQESHESPKKFSYRSG